MKTGVQSAHPTIWYVVVGTLFVTTLIFVYARPAAQVQVKPRSGVATQIFSFDMWCLEMRLYPVARCDARRSDDMKAYELYRAEVEQYGEQRALQERRDQDLKARLNRDPFDVKR